MGGRPVRRRAFTLIELLITIAIFSILSASLAFSASQISLRSAVTRRLLHLESSLAFTLDTVAGDIAQSVAHEINDGALLLTLPAMRGDETRTVTHRLDANRAMRRIETGTHAVEVTLTDDLVSGEFQAATNGLRLTLTGGFDVRQRAIRRGVDVFLAWPEATGVRAP